jgi:hypothetical protein
MVWMAAAAAAVVGAPAARLDPARAGVAAATSVGAVQPAAAVADAGSGAAQRRAADAGAYDHAGP